MLHPDILTISYRHRHTIRQAFKDVVGFKNIVHFSLDLVRPDGQMVFFSSTPSHGYEVCSKGYGAYDATISPEYYRNKSFYWWDEVKHKRYSREIDYIKRVRHGFRHGFMMVRKWDDFYLIYSFASSSDSRRFVEQVEDERDHYLSLGDHIYSSMRESYSEYTGDFVPPKLDRFYPYRGGQPSAYQSDYFKTAGGVLLPKAKKKESSQNVHLRLVVDNKKSKLTHLDN
jgi:hypothetical protein